MRPFSTASFTTPAAARLVADDHRGPHLRHRALVAIERDDRLMWSLHSAALNHGFPPVIPAGVLAEGWRGGPQAALSRLLEGCRIEPLSESLARATGALAARSGHDDVIDVAVVGGAIRRSHAVVTSNATHIRTIADAAGIALVVHAV